MKKAFTLIEIVVTIAILTVILTLILSAFVSAKTKVNSTQCITQIRQIGQAMQLYSSDYDGSVPPVTTAEFVEHQSAGPIKWRELLQVYLQKTSFPTCPSVQLPSSMKPYQGSPNVCGYAYNGWLNSEVKILIPEGKQQTHYTGLAESVLQFSTLTVTVIEARAGIIARRSPDIGKEIHGIWAMDFTAEIEVQPEGGRRHNNGANYLFADEHIKWSTPDGIKTGQICDGINPGFGL